MTSFDIGPIEVWLYWNPRHMTWPYVTGPMRDHNEQPICYFQLGLGILELVMWSSAIRQ